MRLASAKSTVRRLIAVLALGVFAVRALVPVGFMPAPGRLFSLELCPDGLPSEMLHAGMHHHDEGGATHPHPNKIEHCTFGCASALALAAHPPAIDLLLSATLLPAARFTPQRTGWLLLRIPLPRGPPARV